MVQTLDLKVGNARIVDGSGFSIAPLSTEAVPYSTQHSVVSGVQIVPVGALQGRVLRSGRDTETPRLLVVPGASA